MRLEMRFRSEVYENRHREKFPGVQVEAFARVVIAETVRGEKVVGERNVILAGCFYRLELFPEEGNLGVDAFFEAVLGSPIGRLSVCLDGDSLALENGACHFCCVCGAGKPAVRRALVYRFEDFFRGKDLAVERFVNLLGEKHFRLLDGERYD